MQLGRDLRTVTELIDNEEAAFVRIEDCPHEPIHRSVQLFLIWRVENRDTSDGRSKSTAAVNLQGSGASSVLDADLRDFHGQDPDGCLQTKLL